MSKSSASRSLAAAAKIARAILPALPIKRALPARSAAAAKRETPFERLETRTLMSVAAPDSSLAYDMSGNLHVAYYDAASKSLKYTRQDTAGMWSAPVTIDSSSADVGRQVSLAIDSSGKPGVAYRDEANADLKYAHLDGTQWTVATVDSKDDVGTRPSLAFDGSGAATISYYRKSSGDLRLATQVKRKWKITTLAKKGDVGEFSSLAINPTTGKPTVAFTDADGKVAFIQPKKGGGAAKPVVVDDLNTAGGAVSLAFGADGKPAFSYYDASTGAIKVAQGDGKTFGVSTVATVPTGDDPGATLLFDATTGKPQVVYYDSASNGVFLAAPTPGGSFGKTQIQTGGEGTRAVVQPGNGSISFATIDTTDGTPQLTINNTATTPLPPTDVAAAAVSDSAITVTWADNATNETGYMIERSLDGATFETVGLVAVNATTYADTGLAEGTTYYYRVSATAAVAATPRVGAGVNAVVTATTLPAAPTGLAAVADSDTQVTITWTDHSAHETGFKLQRSTDGGTTWADMGTLGPDATSFVDSNVSEGQSFSYRVSAYNGGGSSAVSGPVAVTAPPVAPTGVTVVRAATTQLNVSWTDASAVETGYVLERGTDGTTFAPVATLDAGVTTYSDSGLTDNTAYYYRVKAVGTGGASSYSAVSNAVTDPNAPSNLAATPVSASRIDLTWTGNANNPSNYVVQRSAGGGAFVTVATVPANTPSYSDTGRTEGTLYTYRVRVTGGSADSTFSAPVAVYTLPAAPTGLSASLTGAAGFQVALTWADNSAGETSYAVQRSADGGTTWTTLATLASNATGYADTTGAEGRAYAYRVRAANAGGASNFSNTISLTTKAAAPTGTLAAAASATSAVVTWTDASAGETGYKIERSTDGVTFVTAGTVGADVATFTDTGLSAAASYTYRVRATNAAGDSPAGNTAAVLTLPLAPANVTAAAVSAGRVNIAWDAVAGAASYTVFRTGGTGPANSGPVSGTSYADTGVVEGTAYTYTVVANNASGGSVASSAATATTFPAAATGVTATAPSATTVHLTWADNSAGETGYVITRSGDDGVTFSQIASRPAGTVSYDDATAVEATRYLYVVSAVNAGGQTPAAPAVVTTRPVAPTGVSAAATSATSVTVTWTNASAAATGFRVERSDDFGGTFNPVGTVGAGVSTYTDATVSPNASYAYRVVAIGAGGDSVSNNIDGAVTPTIAPTTLAAAANADGTVGLTWVAPDGALSYVVERSADGVHFAAIDTSDDADYTDATAAEATTYAYRVLAVNGGGNSAYSNAAPVTTIPAAPTTLVAAPAGPTTVNLTWQDNSAGETGYMVERSDDNGVTFSPVVSLGGNVASYAATVGEGGEYVFRVFAVDAGGASAFSNAATVATPPAAPTDLTAAADSQTQVTLHWSDHSDHETGFLVERSAGSGPFVQIDTVAAGVTTYADASAVEGTSYTYRVRAAIGAGRRSAFTATAAAVTPPAAPTGLSATLSGAGVALVWADNSNGETGFRIERSTGGGAFAQIDTVGASVTAYADTTTVPGTTYSYRVRAYNAGGDSAFTAAADATLISAVPQNLTATTLPSLDVQLHWDDVAGEAGYHLDRSDDNGATWTTIQSTGIGVTTYTDTTAAELSSYQYRVRSYNASGESANGTTASATTFLAVPTNLQVTAGGPTTVNLTWADHSGNEQGYDVERSTDGVNFTVVASVGANATSATDTTAADGTAYTYRVRSTGSQGNSDYTPAVDVTTPLSAPTGLAATTVSAGRIDLAWDDNAQSELGYVVYRRTGGGSFVQIDSVGAGVESYTDATVAEATDYAYRVVAVNAIATSAASNDASATTLPAAPTGLSAAAASTTAIALTWADHSAGETGYAILRSTDGTTFSAHATAAASATTFTDTGLTEGTTYYYKVVATNSAGSSAESNVSSDETFPAAPDTLAAAAASSSAISLTWVNHSAHATGFLIERAVGAGSFSTLTTVPSSQTSYTDASLPEGTTYRYRVTAYAAHSSAASNVATGTTLSAAPSALAADGVTAGSIHLTWTDNSNGETGYKVQRFDGAAFVTIHTTAAGVTAYTDASVDEATEYMYRVVAANAGGDSDPSDFIEILTLPAGPTGAAASAPSASTVHVTWTDNSDGETGFRIERSTNGTTFGAVGTTLSGATSFDDTTCAPATSYTYRVVAVNDAGDSVASNAAAALTRPAVPATVSAVTASAARVDVAWDAVAGATYYVVERSTDGTTFSAVYTTPDATTRTLADTGRAESTTYTYRVRAANASGTGAASATAAARTLPAAPTGLTATGVSPTQVNLAWTNASTSATSYRVLRSSGGAFAQVGSTLAASATSFSDTTVAGGTAYTYRVIANDGTADSLTTATAGVTTVPVAPAHLLAISNTATEVELTWYDSFGATGYRVERSSDNGATYGAPVSVGDTHYVDSTATEATAYTYRVTAVGNGGTGPASTRNITTLPAAPVGLTVTSYTDTTVSLSWTDVSAGEGGYLLERSTNGTSWSTVTNTLPNVHTYTDTTAAEATAYLYRVIAVSGAGNSTTSVTDVTTRPAAPSAVTPVGHADGSVSLSWTNNSAAATGFYVQRRTGGGAWGTIVSGIAPGTLTYTDSTPVGGTTYQYRVIATGVGGDSAGSTPASILTVPAQVTDVAATAVTATRIDLAWTDVGGNTGYTIRRSVAGGGFVDYDTAGADATTYSDTSAPEGTLVAYQLVAYNATGSNNPGNTSSATTVPATPTGLAATHPSATSIHVAWTDNSAHETGYVIERSADGSSWSVLNSSLSAGAQSYDDTVSPGSTYYYRVYAVGAAGNSARSNVDHTSTVPDAVGSLAAAATDDTHVHLTWTDVAGETGYRVERSADAGSTWTTLNAAVAANATSYDDATAAEVTAYVYRVTAFNSAGDGAGSTANVSTPPAAPTALHTTAVATTTADLAWTDHSGGESGFTLERSADAGSTWTPLGPVAANTTTFHDTGLTGATTYSYRVRADNGATHSAFATATVLTTPAAVTGLAGTPVSATEIDLTWTDATGETGYKVERSADAGSTWSTLNAAVAANATGYNDTGAAGGTTYVYRVTPFNATGDGTSATVTAQTMPAQPQGVAAVATIHTVDSIDVTWTAVTGADTYTVERSLDNGVSFSFLSTVSVASLQDTGLTSATRYVYRVTATNESGNSVTSATAGATTYADAPTNLLAAASSTTAVHVSWTDVTGETSYKLYRAPHGGGFSLIASPAADATSYDDTGRTESTQYDYKLVAVDAAGDGEASGVATVTTLPVAPAGVGAAEVSATAIDVTWTDTSANLTGFKVYRSTGGAYTQVGTAGAADAVFHDTGLTPGTTYTYKVVAVNASGDSAFSGTASALTRPAAVTNLQASAASDTEIDLAWDTTTGATGYRVYRQDNGGGSFNQLGSDLTGGVHAYQDTTAIAGDSYVYRVVAYNATAAGAAANTGSVVTLPPVPLNPAATPTSVHGITFEWDDGAGETGYTVERAVGAGAFAALTTVGAGVHSITDTVLGGTTYHYRVKATNASGASGWSATADGLTIPEAPTDLAAAASSATAVHLTWSGVTGAASYKLYRDDGGGFNQIATPAGNATSYDNTGLTEGTAYTYKLVAVNATGDSAASNTPSVTTLPGTPSGVSAASVTTTAFTLQWVDNSDNEDNFEVQRYNDGTLSWDANGTAAAVAGHGSGVSQSESSLTEGSSYQYRVRAVQGALNSAWTAPYTVYTVSAAPTGLDATPASATSVHLAWADNSNGEDGYRVERSLAGNNSWTVVTLTDPNETEYTNTGLTEGTAYDFRVIAVNGGTSSTATTDTVTTLPAAPSGLAATATSPTHVGLTWTLNSANEDGVVIQRSADGVTYSTIHTSAAGATSYTDTAASEAVVNYYRVYATQGVLNSAYSGAANATTPLAAPTSLVAAATAHNTVHLTWTDNSGAETGFRIDRRVSGTPTWAPVNEVLANVVQYDDTTAAEDTQYDYRVVALKGAGITSAASNTDDATTPLAIPTGFAAASHTDTTVTLTWTNASAAADTVHIERYNAGTLAYDEIGTVAGNVSTYDDTGLAEDEEYTYRIYATKTGNASGNTATATATVVPTAPDTMAATPFSLTRVDLTWDDHSSVETAYVVERSVNGGAFATLTTLAADVEAYNDTTAVEGTAYAYRVHAVNAGGNSVNTNTATATTNPASPTGLAATPVTATRVDLSWADNSGGETGYEVDRSVNGGVSWTTITTTAASVTTYSDTGATEGIAINYRVRAVKTGGHNSGYTTAAATTVPAAPTGLATATPSGSPRVTLSWTDHSTHETGFAVERSADAGVSWDPVTTTAANAASYSDSTVSEGMSYLYRVSATGSGGHSLYTSEVAANVPPAAPSGLTVTSSSPTAIGLSWTNNSTAATGVRLERSVNGGLWATLTTLAAGATTYTDSVTENVNYDYRVLATTAGSVSTVNGTVTVKAPLAAPTGATAVLSGSQIHVTWTDHSGAETGFQVQRSADGGGWSTITTTGANAGSYDDSAVSPGVAYAYRVKATRAGNASAYNTSSPVTTLPTDTTNLLVSAASDTTVNLTWTEAVGETSYTVERSADAGSIWSVLTTAVAANAGGYSDTTATENTAYLYRVKAVNVSGPSAYATSASVTTLPAAPGGTLATTTDPDTVVVTWTDHSNSETGFKVERSADAGSTWSQITTVGANVTTYTDTAVTESSAYRYRVRAYTGGRNSVYGNAVDVTTLPTDPDTLTVTATTTTSIALSWNNTSAHAAAYSIERSTDGGSTFSEITTVAGNVSTYTDTGRSEGTEYIYRVRASNGDGGYSFYTNAISGTTRPAAPSVLTANAISATRVDLAWTDNSGGELGFKVERRVGAGSWVLLTTVGPDVLAYSDTTTLTGTGYSYRVYAYNAGGNSANSNAPTVTTP